MTSPCQEYFLSVWRVDGGLVVRPIGRLPHDGSWLEDDKILRMAEQIVGDRLYLDFRRTPFFAAEAMENLLRAWRLTRDRGGRVVVCGSLKRNRLDPFTTTTIARNYSTFARKAPWRWPDTPRSFLDGLERRGRAQAGRSHLRRPRLRTDAATGRHAR